MVEIMACMECGGKELDPVYSAQGAFIGTYKCRSCGSVGPVVTFGDEASYEEYKILLSK